MLKEISTYIPFILIPFMGWGVSHYLKKKNDFNALKKITLSIGLIAFFVTEMTRSFWRPYVYKNEIFDYYFSDTIGNSFGTITAIFMLLTMVGKGNKQYWKLIALVIIGLIIYDYMGYPSKFDFNDVIATIIFAIISLFSYLIMLKNKSISNSKN